jgi:hypothetical protein
MFIAEYYQAQQDWGKAGEFYALCAQYHKALKLFLQCGESEMDKVSYSRHSCHCMPPQYTHWFMLAPSVCTCLAPHTLLTHPPLLLSPRSASHFSSRQSTWSERHDLTC